MEIKGFRSEISVERYTDDDLPLKYRIPHPNPLCIPGNLAFARPALPEYGEIKHFLRFPEILDSSLVSGPQIDATLCALTQFVGPLRNGYQPGICIADQSGWGKTRIASLIILELFGEDIITDVLWLSSNIQLSGEVKKEVETLRGNFLERNTNFVVYNGSTTKESELKKMPRRANITPSKNTIVFSAYSALVAGGNYFKNLFEIANWMGPNFNGVIVFDESHKARNEKTKAALVVKWLQYKFPLARIIYMTATIGPEPHHLAYMSRLDLWGEGCPFFDKFDFVEKMSIRGVSAMEFIALHLAKRRFLVTQQLDLKDVEINDQEIALTPEQCALYDDCCIMWQALLLYLNTLTPKELNSIEMGPSTYWSCHQRFFEALLTTFKAEHVTSIREAYPVQPDPTNPAKKGYSLVVALQMTGCEAWERLGKSNQEGKHFSLCGTILYELFIKLKISITYLGKLNVLEIENVSDNVKELIGLYQQLVPSLGRNPIDQILDDLGGFEQCAEISGRTSRQVQVAESDDLSDEEADKYARFSCHSMSEHSVDNERQAFMDGTKMAVIITQKGSTGISLHSDRNVKNQTQRVQVCIQIPWSPQQAVEQLGRTNRCGQVNAPIFVHLRTNVPGEQRFSTVLITRLSKLGAMCQGERRTTFNLADGSKYPFGSHPVVASRAAKAVILQIMEDVDIEQYLFEQASRVNLIPSRPDSTFTMPITRFLNRMLGMKLQAQKEIFDLLMIEYEDLLREMSRNMELDSTMLSKTPGLALAYAGNLSYGRKEDGCKIYRIIADRGLSWSNLQIHVQKQIDKNKTPTYFMRDREIMCAFIAGIYEEMVISYRVWTPWSCNSVEWLSEAVEKWTLVRDFCDAERLWSLQHNLGRTLEFCVHKLRGDHCLDEKYCVKGCRRYLLYVLTGNVLKVWDALAKVFKPIDSKHPIAPMKTIKISLSRKHQNEVPIREKFIGINIPIVLLDNVKAALVALYASTPDSTLVQCKRQESDKRLANEIKVIEDEWKTFTASKSEWPSAVDDEMDNDDFNYEIGETLLEEMDYRR